MRRGSSLFPAYAAAVIAVGLSAYAVLLASTPQWGLNSGEFWVLAPLIIIAELVPLRVPRGDREGELTLSTTGGFALLLVAGPVAASTALALGSVIEDLVRRKPPWKALFNAAHYLLAVAAAAVVIDASGTWYAGASTSWPAIVAALVAGSVFALVNTLVMAAALSIASGAAGVGSAPVTVRAILRGDAPFLAWSYTVLMSLGPIVALTADANLWAVPLFTVPTVAVYQSVSIYLDRKRHVLHDRLTGLPNRALFEDRIAQAVAIAQRRASSIAVLVINIDRFKEVNATYGYTVGNRMLTDVARRLEDQVSDVDTVARLDADEFGVLLSGVGGADEVDATISRLRKAVDRPFAIAGENVAVEASVGAVLAPENGTRPAELISNADGAMGQAKRQRFGHLWYAPQPRATGRMRMLADLRVALDSGDLELHYQPKASLPSGHISGVEALVRWRREGGELVPPAQFIPVAEDTGLMGDMTRYVLDDAIAQMRRWRDAGTDFGVAVNISARDLHDTQLPGDIAAMLSRHGVPATSLELEITESSIMADIDRAMATLSQLHDMGIRLAIDDFGTGNTSLAQLPRLPIDVLKIDRSFVERLEYGADDLIVRTTIELGRGLGLDVVAEGVATSVVWDRLVELGCDYAQGFYLSRPVPAPDIALLIGHPTG